MTKTKRF